jgi:hypothetical protein
LSAAERETLRSQVSLLDDGIVSWREAPVTTTRQINAYAERLAELVQPMEAYVLLIDLTNTIRPSPEVLDCSACTWITRLSTTARPSSRPQRTAIRCCRVCR